VRWEIGPLDLIYESPLQAAASLASMQGTEGWKGGRAARHGAGGEGLRAAHGIFGQRVLVMRTKAVWRDVETDVSLAGVQGHLGRRS
jgi:hypothetical protein